MTPHADVVSQMVTSHHYDGVFEGKRLDFGKWHVKEAHGVLNCGSR